MIIRSLLVALVILLVSLTIQTWRLNSEKLSHAQTRESHALLMVTINNAARDAEQKARAVERDRIEALQGIIHDTEQQLKKARADAAFAADAGARLRRTIAALTTSCRSGTNDSAATTASDSTDSTNNLLANVQRRLDEAADGIAQFADTAYTAGIACQQSYDALIKHSSQD